MNNAAHNALLNPLQTKTFNLYDKPLTIAAGAITDDTFNAEGNYVGCSFATEEFLISFDDKPFFSFDQNKAIPFIAYKSISVRNKNPTRELKVVLTLGYGYIEDNRFFIRAGAIPVQSPHQFYSQSYDIVNPSPTGEHPRKVANFNANRVELIIQNTHPTEPVTWGETPAKALEGFPIPAGGVRVINSCSEFYVACAEGKASCVRVGDNLYNFENVFF